MRTVAILPVKSFGRAKQRLGTAFPDRPALAAAMVSDVLEALGRVETLSGVIVVTAEAFAADAAREAGAEVVPDPAEAGQSAAVALGIAHADADRVLLVPGDCPALDPDEVTKLLAHTAPVVIVPDRHGTGTNAVVARPRPPRPRHHRAAPPPAGRDRSALGRGLVRPPFVARRR